MASITYRVYDNIDSIDKRDWDAIFGKIPESYQFFRVFGNSGLNGVSFYYLVFYSDNTIVFIAPLFSKDFNLDVAVEGWPVRAINFIRRLYPRFLIFRTLFCGSLCGEYGILGFRDDFKKDPRMVSLLSFRLNDLARKLNCPLIVFKDFTQQYALILDALIPEGFSKLESFPTVSVELNFNSFEEYLASLGKSTRKNLTKKLKQAYARTSLEVKIVDDVKECIDQVAKLYENTYQDSTLKFEHLTKQFFLQLSLDLREHTRFFLYYCDGRLAAFNLCFIYNNLMIDKFIGFDYDISNKYNLYFVSWAHNIKWCINNKIYSYFPGQSNYEPKIRLGGKLITLFAYLKHRNPCFNHLLKLLKILLKPDNFDKNIKRKTYD